MVTRPKINLREYTCTMELTKQIVDPGQWILVFDGDIVESTIVNTDPLCAIFLRDEKDRGSPWRCPSLQALESGP
jgi:hypothetical protein